MEKPSPEILAKREGLLARLKHLIAERDFWWSEDQRLHEVYANFLDHPSVAHGLFSPDGETVEELNLAKVNGLEKKYYRGRLDLIQKEICEKVLPLAIQLGMTNVKRVRDALEYYKYEMKAQENKK